MSKYLLGLECESCGHQIGPMDGGNTCPSCGGLLEAKYDYSTLRKTVSRRVWSERAPTIWRWKELLPVSDEHIVSLGEGCTPLVRSKSIADAFGMSSVHLKNDTMNPTFTFKDRSFSVAVSRALEIGQRRAFTYTSGNAGASFAAYARRAGMDAFILVKGWASIQKLAMMRSFGFPVILWDFDTFEPVKEILRRATEELGAYQFTVFNNPYRHEGNKSYAYEIWQDFGEQVPDWVIHPTSSGGGIVGAWKGFEELRLLGLTDRMPRMVAVQPAECAPIELAFRENLEAAPRHGSPRATIAQSMSTDTPVGDGRRVLRAVRQTRGTVVSVTDDEIIGAIADLGRDGIFAEPAGASTVAALRKLVTNGTIQPGESVVCIITGAGLKQPDVVDKVFGAELSRIGATWSEFVTLAEGVWKGDRR